MLKFLAFGMCHVTRCHGNGGHLGFGKIASCSTGNVINQERYIVYLTGIN